MRKRSEEKRQQGLRPALVVEGLQISDGSKQCGAGRIIWTQSLKSFTMTLLPHVHIEEPPLSKRHEPASLSMRVDTFRGALQALETLVICSEVAAVRGVPTARARRAVLPERNSSPRFGHRIREISWWLEALPYDIPGPTEGRQNFAVAR